jgi:prolyl-tRNA synthetase
MRYSQLLAKTQRQVPSDIRAVSYRLLLRGGYIRPLAQGLFSLLPLGQRVLHKLKAIVAAEMERLGGLEVSVPLVNPMGLWRRSGRETLVGEDLAKFTDRSGRQMVLAPSHEEAMVELIRTSINSYRDFPVFLYQFQTKFRDEPKTKCGLIRAREFLMKDAYSFHRSFTELNNFFPKVFGAYQRIFEQCGLEATPVEAGVGYMGGDKAFEFVTACDCGDDVMIECGHCGYRASSDVAVGQPQIPAEPPLEIERVSTPGCNTMGRLAEYLGVPRNRLAKPVVYATDSGLVMAVVRADREVSEEKLIHASGESGVRLAARDELTAAGLVPGYLSPVDCSDAALENILVIIDETVADTPNLVYGANEKDYHYRNVNFGRDFDCRHVADIARVLEGDRCVHCGEELIERGVMELGHIFRLGDYYSRALELSFRGERGERVIPHMGAYGIGMGRLMASIVEQHHDDYGIVWPKHLAPFRFFLMSIGRSVSVRRLAEQVYEALGTDVLLDDREESISTKFKDADLLGIPYRIVVSQRSLTEGEVELMERDTREVRRVSLEHVADLIREETDFGAAGHV